MLPHGMEFLGNLLLDLRAFLHALKFLFRTAENAGQEELPKDVQALSTKWRPIVDKWLTKESEVREQIRHAQGAELDWNSLILQVGNFLEETSELKSEASKLASQAEPLASELIREIQGFATKLEEYQHMITTQEYKEHWAKLVRSIEESGRK